MSQEESGGLNQDSGSGDMGRTGKRLAGSWPEKEGAGSRRSDEWNLSILVLWVDVLLIGTVMGKLEEKGI